MKAIGSRNLLKSYAKQREAQQDQLKALIGKYISVYLPIAVYSNLMKSNKLVVFLWVFFKVIFYILHSKK